MVGAVYIPDNDGTMGRDTTLAIQKGIGWRTAAQATWSFSDKQSSEGGINRLKNLEIFARGESYAMTKSRNPKHVLGSRYSTNHTRYRLPILDHVTRAVSDETGEYNFG